MTYEISTLHLARIVYDIYGKASWEEVRRLDDLLAQTPLETNYLVRQELSGTGLRLFFHCHTDWRTSQITLKEHVQKITGLLTTCKLRLSDSQSAQISSFL